MLDEAIADKRRRDAREAIAEQTAREAREDGARIVSIADPWGALAREDERREEHLRGEDRSLRVVAETPETPKQDKAAGVIHSGTRVSGFWGALEKEDADIEAALQDGRDLSRYQQLTRLQEAQVGNAVAQLSQDVPPRADRPPLRHHDLSIGARSIHDPWAEMEAKDAVKEARVHANPDLQMLQEDSRLRRRPTAAVAR